MRQRPPTSNRTDTLVPYTTRFRAAQSLVDNLLGGLTIYASRPFKVGEWIIMSVTEVMGEVQEIGWRATRIMGFDRKPFYVPNSMFNTGVVINHSDRKSVV